MNVAFKYWEKGCADVVAATENSRVMLTENKAYVLSFDNPPLETNMRELEAVGAEKIDDRTYLLRFQNYVGVATIAGVLVEVFSAKIGRNGTAELLAEVSKKSSALIFGSGTPTGFMVNPEFQSAKSIPYHQLQVLRNSIIHPNPGERLQDFLEIVSRYPTHRIEPERVTVGVENARRLDQRAIHSIATRMEWLVPTKSDRAVASTALGKSLQFGSPPQAHFPYKVTIPRGRLSLNTPENRLVKHIVSDCLALVYRFARDPKLSQSQQKECDDIISTLQIYRHSPALLESAISTSVGAPSQAMLKREGYRQIYSIWQSMYQTYALPLTDEETTEKLEGRDIATLYEYWVFLVIVEAVSRVLGRKPKETRYLQVDDFGEHMRHGFSVLFGEEVSVHYNFSFSRSRGTSYSTLLRPDVVLQIGENLHIFDAKYKLSNLDLDDSNEDDGQGRSRYKREDLYKMHAYRDAICDAESAFVIYPGTVFSFFEVGGEHRRDIESIECTSGVGAVPLRPSDVKDRTTAISSLISKILELTI